MKTVVLVSRCLKVNRDYCELHFKGCLEGSLIRMVRLKTTKQLSKGEEYIIWLGVEKIEDGVLWGKAQKIRNLGDLKIDL